MTYQEEQDDYLTSIGLAVICFASLVIIGLAWLGIYLWSKLVS